MKVTEDIKKKLQEVYDKGYTIKETAVIVGVSGRTVQKYIKTRPQKKAVFIKDSCTNCSIPIEFNIKDIRENNFCSKSCAATFNNKLRKKPKSPCRNCGKETPTYQNVYCGITCSTEDKFKKKLQEFYKGKVKYTTTLRKILSHLYGNKCSECNIPNKWNGKKLVLHVDHIDGNSDNNNSDNLRLLCPNCHSQTPTYCGGGNNKDTKRNRYLRKYKGY